MVRDALGDVRDESLEGCSFGAIGEGSLRYAELVAATYGGDGRGDALIREIVSGLVDLLGAAAAKALRTAQVGYSVSISRLCRWFEIPRRTVYYRPTRKTPVVQSDSHSRSSR